MGTYNAENIATRSPTIWHKVPQALIRKGQKCQGCWCIAISNDLDGYEAAIHCESELVPEPLTNLVVVTRNAVRPVFLNTGLCSGLLDAQQRVAVTVTTTNTD